MSDQTATPQPQPCPRCSTPLDIHGTRGGVTIYHQYGVCPWEQGIPVGPYVYGYGPRRIPHCCPACNGWGKRDEVLPASDTVASRPVTCLACFGTGIVWGPA